MRIQEFVTSDHHIGHKNILKFCPNRASSLDEMHHKIIVKHNKKVRQNDVCWFLGDFGMGSVGIMKEVLSQMNGKKLLVLGNHDRGKIAMMNIGFQAVMYNMTTIIESEIVTMSHCPLLGLYRENVKLFKQHNPDENWHGELKQGYRKFTMINNNQFHLHGHLHGPNGGASNVKEGKQWDIGLDGNHMQPVSFGEVESWIRKYKHGLDNG